MASDNFERCHRVTDKFEGGYVNHPKDPGGATNRGVIQKVYDAWRRRIGKPVRSVKFIAYDEVLAIYREDYWTPLKGDDLPIGVDLATFDFGVNSGIGRAAKYLQAVVGADIDGRIGPATLAKVAAGKAADIVKALCAKRLGFVQSLKIWDTFGKGWGRRIAGIEATALSWILSAPELEAESAAAKKQSNKDAGGAVTSPMGGAAVPGADAIANGAINWWLVGGVGALVLILVIYLGSRAVIHSERAKALAAAAKGKSK